MPEPEHEDMRSEIEALKLRVAQIERLIKGAGPLPAGGLMATVLWMNPTSDTETALVIAYGLEETEGVSPVNVDDMNRGYELARQNVPVNVNDVMNKLCRRHLLALVKSQKDGRKAWRVSPQGLDFLRAKLGPAD
jgi:hypothetical protein